MLTHHLFPIVTEDMQQRAVEVTSQAFDNHNLEKDIAMYIKKEFDRLYGTTWHCVVGKKWVPSSIFPRPSPLGLFAGRAPHCAEATRKRTIS